MLVRNTALTVRCIRLPGRLAVALTILASLWLAAPAPAAAQTEWDHTKIVGPNACAECHKKTVRPGTRLEAGP